MLLLGRTSTCVFSPSPTTYTYIYICTSLSDAGKTVLLTKLVSEFGRVFDADIGRFVLVFAHWQELYDQMIGSLPADVEVLKFQGLSEDVFSRKTLKATGGGGDDDDNNNNKVTLVIFDDVVATLLRRKFEEQINQLVTIHAHHWRVAPVFVLQSVAFKLPSLSLLLNNSRYLIASFFDSTLPTSLAQVLQVRERERETCTPNGKKPLFKRTAFPGPGTTNLISSIVAFLKKNNRSYFVIDVSTGEVLADVFENSCPTLVEW